MTVGDLIELLKGYHPSDVVVVQEVGNSDTTPWQGVTGVTCYPGTAAIRVYKA